MRLRAARTSDRSGIVSSVTTRVYHQPVSEPHRTGKGVTVAATSAGVRRACREGNVPRSVYLVGNRYDRSGPSVASSGGVAVCAAPASGPAAPARERLRACCEFGVDLAGSAHRGSRRNHVAGERCPATRWRALPRADVGASLRQGRPAAARRPWLAGVDPVPDAAADRRRAVLVADGPGGTGPGLVG